MTMAPVMASQPERLPEMKPATTSMTTSTTAVTRAPRVRSPNPPMATEVISVSTVKTTLGLPQVMPSRAGRKGGMRISPTVPPLDPRCTDQTM